jgi:hypothetical protein
MLSKNNPLPVFVMSDELFEQAAQPPEEEEERKGRRLFLRSMGKWSGAAVGAVVAVTWLESGTEAQAGIWINRRWCGGRPRPGRWINNRWRPGGSWLNRGPGGWINRRCGRPGSWINRW